MGRQHAHTLLTGEQQAVVMEDFQIRKLTPLECWRLQAFPDEAFLAAKFGSREIAKKILVNQLDHYNCDYKQTMSDSQLYKQAGNSVTVAVIYDIAKRL
ncbi:DNA cytosine methyltransferase [Enterococcus faecalis]|uniref:DNA cytosine methyltransferase n=1 Tax=Enterococcus faecalis TaxID=1351 RepID=UPI001F50E3DB|nr:DNA cytosine methyltransferase [Enterococcus faecalis]